MQILQCVPPLAVPRWDVHALRFPPLDCARDSWERADDVSVRAPWQLGGAGLPAAEREVRSELWGPEYWARGFRKGVVPSTIALPNSIAP